MTRTEAIQDLILERLREIPGDIARLSAKVDILTLRVGSLMSTGRRIPSFSSCR
jgi:hypothetical protein